MKQGAVRIWKHYPSRDEFSHGYFVVRENGQDPYEGRFALYLRTFHFKGFTFEGRFRRPSIAKLAAELISTAEKVPVSLNERKP